jgi:hypothetical protein
MNRRKAIQSIVIASAATVFFTGCGDKNVVDQVIGGKLRLDEKHHEYLGIICETFLPVKGVSIKIGNPVDFILTMVNDCRSSAQKMDFAIGFEQYKLLMKGSKLRIKKADPVDVIKTVEEILKLEAPQKEMLYFIETVKDLSIQNLKSSEYYISDYLEYQLIPSEYIPCLDV